jgi:hypothetical protein
MKLSDFILLNEEEKKLIVLHEGVLIGKRKKPDRIVFLFQLNGFYVETFGDTQTKDIVEFRMFEHTKLLHPYLEAIVIDDLLGK